MYVLIMKGAPHSVAMLYSIT